MEEHALIGLALILILGIGAQWLAWRLRLPAILLLLLTGILAGPVTGLLHVNELLGDLIFPVISLSIAVILFEGGLTLKLAELRAAGSVIIRLVTVGALITWMVTSVAARYILNLDVRISLILGAILVVTGPTVIGPLLRQIRPSGPSGITLKWEGILIDPLGVTLAILVFEAILIGELNAAPLGILIGMVTTLGAGILVGAVGALFLIIILRRHWVPDYLQGSVALLTVMAAYAGADLLRPEAGLLSVTLMGIALANQRWVAVRHIVEFKENLSVLLIGSLFILLAARLDPETLQYLDGRVLGFLAVLVLIGRPLAVWISSSRAGFTLRDKLFLSWLAPRGIVAAAVSALFAERLQAAGFEQANLLVPYVFFTILFTVALYGLTAAPLARALGLSELNPQGLLLVGAQPLNRAIAQVLCQQGVQVLLLDKNFNNIAHAQMEGLPAHFGDVLDEEMLEEVNLTGLGRLLALTANDEVNALAALHLSETFGRTNVFQLPTAGLDAPDRAGRAVPHLRGRVLFEKTAHYAHLQSMFEQGAQVKATNLTSQFNFEDFKKRHGQDAVPLFAINGQKQVTVFTTEMDTALEVGPGQTLVSLTPPKSK